MSAMPTAANKLELMALPGLPLVQPGDDLVTVIADGLDRLGERLRDRDVLVLAQKIVSKSENRFVDLRDITPSERAKAIAEEVDKDPRLIEVILAESIEVLRTRPGVIIVQNRQGLVMANAGIDASNVEQAGGSERVLLLPVDPDASCRRLREGLKARFGVDVAVVVNDSVGRAWRNGTVGLAIGSAGLPAIMDLRGEPDLFGRILQVSQVALADELAAAASIVQGQGKEGQPVVLVRGLTVPQDELPATALLRPLAEDMFR